MLQNSLFRRLFQGVSIVAIYIPREERKMIWVRACLHGRGEPQVGEVTHLGGVKK